jgi:hypothetical protein
MISTRRLVESLWSVLAIIDKFDVVPITFIPHGSIIHLFIKHFFSFDNSYLHFHHIPRLAFPNLKCRCGVLVVAITVLVFNIHGTFTRTLPTPFSLYSSRSCFHHFAQCLNVGVHVPASTISLAGPKKKSQSHPNTPTHARDAHNGKKEMMDLWYRGDSNPRGLLHENASSEEDKLALESHAITTRPRYLILYDKEIGFTINITRLTTKRQTSSKFGTENSEGWRQQCGARSTGEGGVSGRCYRRIGCRLTHILVRKTHAF